MVVDPSALFPDEMAADLLEIVGNTDDLAGELPIVRETVSTVRRMLGDYQAVDDAIAVWNQHAVAQVVQSQTLIKDTLPQLDAYWDGPAYRAYRTYATDVVDRIGEVQSSLEQVGAALTNVLDTITRQYQAAVESLTNLASALLDLAGSAGRRVPSDLIDAALSLIQTFLQEVKSYVEQVLATMHENNQALNEMAQVDATLQIPSPVDRTAPVIGQPDGWQLRPDVPATW